MRPCGAADAADSRGVGLPRLPPLEAYPMIDAAAFEVQWSQAERHFKTRTAGFPPTPLLTPDEVEAGLTHAGLMCIAAGAIGPIHKSYFAAQLRSTGEWLMLELVVYWEARPAAICARPAAICAQPAAICARPATLCARPATTRTHARAHLLPLVHS